MYKLMNKDRCIGEFKIITDSKGRERAVGIVRGVGVYGRYSSIDTIIKSRMAPKNRENIEIVYRKNGCNSIEQYLNRTHAVSFIDTLWVKGVDDDTTWEDVSLFKNEFNSTISDLALDGKGHNGDLEGLTPELTTNGTYAKCWSREESGVYLLKAGSRGFANSGLEPYSEYYSSQVIDALGVNHVQYGLSERNGLVVSKCKRFTSENVGYMPMSSYNKNVGSLNDLINAYDEIGFTSEIVDMLMVDSIIMNEDRHLGNLGVIYDTNSGEVYGVNPMFDHNVSLLCYAMQSDFEDIDNYVYSNNKGHKLGGSTFESVAKELLNDTWRRKLSNLYGFKLKKHDKFNLPDWRIEELNKLINGQIEKILKE